jgi:hypothetical protein
MNKRIQELEKQATTVVEGWSDEIGTTRYYEFDRKKFAELLLQECLLKINGAKIRNESYAELIERIKEDFGVVN